ncbi:16S rRNA (cytidine(1402)-2'-O)-methyltransferase [Cyanobacterium stanieri LEGE 03274]|uniref:Ribosomal RNA small subunit methyltransferase I n=1 Tax=Cyanobacterium stanieri LEGE 03274 TaxID=1828756 RepID=A0ABR9V359_9CHRO|nr:16S rRNA (cytidine(1402)-2'-O)-methyltransferase [Cyanobacterium stanieri]MBE9221254.1 16S rRNA (cytidine(1402)-2'-O)-methyltransferase [Cyanobacterium stanieri LEGE 03274]
MTGILYLVATPIGNLEDMTFRGLKVLESVDLIGAEDTRHTGKLLHHFQVKTPMVSYHQHNFQSRVAEFIPRLKGGESIALVTDAGTPAISDPGYNMVRACIEENIQVVPIPGANAGISGLIASGLSTERFVFEGFLPTKKKLRDGLLSELGGEKRTLIFYESPHRLRRTLEDFLGVFGALRQITLARELTKLHEDFWRGTVEGAIALYQEKEPRGEYTIIVAGNENQESEQLSQEEIKDKLRKLINEGISKSEASKQLAKLTNLSRSEIYRLSVEINY